jgi:hypothetical protein
MEALIQQTGPWRATEKERRKPRRAGEGSVDLVNPLLGRNPAKIPGNPPSAKTGIEER